MNKSESITELAKALATAQGLIDGAKRRATNPHLRSKYADLESVWDAIREPLTSNGLSIIQGFEPMENGVLIVTTLLHSSGEWIDSRLQMPLEKATPQGMGSAITYGRRYSLMAIVGVAPEDDDGEAAMVRQQQNIQQQQPHQSQQTQNSPLSEKQLNRMFAIAKTHNVSNDAIREIMKDKFGIDSTKDLTKPQYDELCEKLIPQATTA